MRLLFFLNQMQIVGLTLLRQIRKRQPTSSLAFLRFQQLYVRSNRFTCYTLVCNGLFSGRSGL